MKSILRGGRLAAPLIVLAGLAACADGPSAPAVAREPAPRPSLNTSSAYDASTGAITLYADDGLTYTLVSAQSEIRVNDGTVIELSPSEVVTAVNAFVQAHESGALATSFASAPPPNLDCELGWSTCNRNDLYAGEIGDAPTPVIDAPRLDAGGSSLAQYPSCVDISRSIFDATQLHRERRRAFTDALKAVALVRIGVSGAGPRLRLRDVPNAGLAIEVAAAEHAKSAVQLNVLATLYASYNCWQNGWPGAVGSTFVPTMPGILKKCETRTVDVEMPDGSVIQREVTICEVRMQ